MVNSKNSLNLKKDKNTLKKSISSGRQVDGIVKKQKLNYVEVPIVKKQKEITKTEAIVETNVIKNQNEINNASIDDTKRMFLKVAGVAGLGLAASALFPKSTEAYVTGSTPTSNVVGIKDKLNEKINPATEDTLALIKAQSDKLTFDETSYPANLKVNVAAGDIGLKNISDTPINPATEDTLALIKAQSDKLTFDNNNLSTISGIVDLLNNRINPVQDENVILLRRMVKLMESQATVDFANRQRVTLDSIGVGTPTALTTTMPISGSVSFAATATVLLAGQNQQMFQDVARNTYANGIRNNLIWS